MLFEFATQSVCTAMLPLPSNTGLHEESESSLGYQVPRPKSGTVRTKHSSPFTTRGSDGAGSV